MEIRSFLAFELPSEIKDIVIRVSGELRKSSLDVRWVKADHIHLTMVFMGSIASEKVEAMGYEIQKVCLQTGTFHVSLKGIGFFPHSRSPRVLWVGLGTDMEGMSRFKDALEDILRPFGIKEEKKGFHPHLTLGRFRRPNKKDPQLDEVVMKYKDLTSPVCPLKELVLFKSDLKPSGAVYTRLGAWPLLAGGHKGVTQNGRTMTDDH
jgi:2'-5' RNA ligase